MAEWVEARASLTWREEIIEGIENARRGLHRPVQRRKLRPRACVHVA
jgi:hypothetical protein